MSNFIFIFHLFHRGLRKKKKQKNFWLFVLFGLWLCVSYKRCDLLSLLLTHDLILCYSLLMVKPMCFYFTRFDSSALNYVYRTRTFFVPGAFIKLAVAASNTIVVTAMLCNHTTDTPNTFECTHLSHSQLRRPPENRLKYVKGKRKLSLRKMFALWIAFHKCTRTVT